MIVKGIVQTPVKVRVNKAEPWYCLKTCDHLRRPWDLQFIDGGVWCELFKHRLATHQYEDKTFYHRCKACCDTCKVPRPSSRAVRALEGK